MTATVERTSAQEATKATFIHIGERTNVCGSARFKRLILEGEKSIDVTEEAYWRYNNMIDEKNRQKVWSDRRAQNYYWTDHNRSAVMNPLTGPQMWRYLSTPDFDDFTID